MDDEQSSENMLERKTCYTDGSKTEHGMGARIYWAVKHIEPSRDLSLWIFKLEDTLVA